MVKVLDLIISSTYTLSDSTFIFISYVLVNSTFERFTLTGYVISININIYRCTDTVVLVMWSMSWGTPWDFSTSKPVQTATTTSPSTWRTLHQEISVSTCFIIIIIFIVKPCFSYSFAKVISFTDVYDYKIMTSL